MLRSRIAPTPSGYLHTGNAINFVITWLMVRKEQGSLRLRIDDLDGPRINKEYIEDIFRTLEWLGLDWNEGPQTPAEHERSFSQQLRIDRYHRLIEALRSTGLVFTCTCSRKEIQEQSIDGQYPESCRAKGLPHDVKDASLRIVTPKDRIITIEDRYAGSIPVHLYETIRDVIIRRKDGIPAYHIASIADDVDHGINFIVRGSDLVHSTAVQLYLAELLHLDTFARTQFYHHPLVKDQQGQKLSKSAGSASLKAWRERGAKVEEFYIMLSRMLGWDEAARSSSEMLELAREGRSLVLAGA